MSAESHNPRVGEHINQSPWTVSDNKDTVDTTKVVEGTFVEGFNFVPRTGLRRRVNDGASTSTAANGHIVFGKTARSSATLDLPSDDASGSDEEPPKTDLLECFSPDLTSQSLNFTPIEVRPPQPTLFSSFTFPFRYIRRRFNRQFFRHILPVAVPTSQDMQHLCSVPSKAASNATNKVKDCVKTVKDNISVHKSRLQKQTTDAAHHTKEFIHDKVSVPVKVLARKIASYEPVDVTSLLPTKEEWSELFAIVRMLYISYFLPILTTAFIVLFEPVMQTFVPTRWSEFIKQVFRNLQSYFDSDVGHFDDTQQSLQRRFGNFDVLMTATCSIAHGQYTQRGQIPTETLDSHKRTIEEHILQTAATTRPSDAELALSLRVDGQVKHDGKTLVTTTKGAKINTAHLVLPPGLNVHVIKVIARLRDTDNGVRGPDRVSQPLMFQERVTLPRTMVLYSRIDAFSEAACLLTDRGYILEPTLINVDARLVSMCIEAAINESPDIALHRVDYSTVSTLVTRRASSFLSNNLLLVGEMGQHNSRLPHHEISAIAAHLASAKYASSATTK